LRVVDLLKIDVGLWIFGCSLGRDGNARACWTRSAPTAATRVASGVRLQGGARKSTSALSEPLRGSGEHGSVGLAAMSRVVFRMAIPDARPD
jgi:hypothetical protein